MQISVTIIHIKISKELHHNMSNTSIAEKMDERGKQRQMSFKTEAGSGFSLLKENTNPM